MANQPKKYKKFVATAATATLVASAIVPVASAASFTDVPENSEFAPYIDALTEAGIIKGYTESNTFKPGAALTRGQVVKMLGRWVENNGVAVPSDWNTKARFTDVPTNHKDQELVKYAALVADEGVFGGAAGKLMAGNNITRQQMAKVLNGAYAAVNGESLIEIAEGMDNVLIPDLANARAEFEDAIQALMNLEISSTTSGNFRPLENVTRAQFSKFLFNTIDFEAVDVAPYEVKAVNSTTVEVIFEDEITNIEDIDFAIEGLEIKGAVVKQTSKRTAVLTTSEQKGGTEYTVTVDGEKAGTFTGIAAVVPTAVKLNAQSVQGVIGEEVTLTATVTVPEGQSKEGVSVTFNVTNSSANNEKLEVEAFTNAEGVATYKYTRYYSSEDTVAAYATKKSSVFSNGKVYWAAAKQLTVKDITEATTLVNGAKKVYEINQPSNAGGYVFVAFQENLGVTPDKSQRGAIIEGVTTYTINGNATANIQTQVANGYPYSYTTGGTTVTAVKLDSAGKANLVVSGSNAVVTPIVYSAEYKTDASNNLTYVPAYSATALQAKASTATFELKHALGLTIKAEGVQNAATWASDVQTGGRDYTVTYTDKDGKAATPNTLVKIAIPRVGGNVSVLNSDGDEIDSIGSDAANVYYELPVEAKGQLTFTVVSASPTAYVAPIVFIDNGKKVNNVPNGVLDTDDLQAQGEITYFTNQVQYSAALKALDAPNGKPVSSVVYGGTNAYFTYELVDQNGKPRAYTQDTVVSFEVTAGTGAINVNGTRIEAGNTATVRSTIAAGATSTFVPASAYTPSSITATATGSRAGVVLPSTNPASVTVNFTQYGTSAITGTAVNVNRALEVLTINDVVYSYADATYKYNNNVITKSAFVGYIGNNDAKVSITVDADGKFTFNVLPATTTPGVGSVLERVNAATTTAQVQAALAGYPLYDALSDSDKGTAAAAIHSGVVNTGAYTDSTLESYFTTTFAYLTTDITATSLYTAAVAAVPAAKATGTDSTVGITLTAKNAGTTLNTYTVTVVNTNTGNQSVVVDRDDTAKTIEIDVANQAGGAVKSTVADVIAALEAEGLDVTTTITGTDFADALVGTTVALSGGTTGSPATAANLAVTYTQNVDVEVGDAVVVNLTTGGATVALTGTVADIDTETFEVTINFTNVTALAAGTTYTVTSINGIDAITEEAFDYTGATLITP